MIVREILERPEIINRFDHFNDSKDTISWLRSIGKHELADRLEVEYFEWRCGYTR
jgi:hypothetical protein